MSRKFCLERPKSLKTFPYKIQRFESTQAQEKFHEHHADLASDSLENPTFLESFEIEEPLQETVDELAEAEKDAKNEQGSVDKKKKRRTKNPVPSQTIDGKQLTFVEETKVFAEMDALLKHGRVSSYFCGTQVSNFQEIWKAVMKLGIMWGWISDPTGSQSFISLNSAIIRILPSLVGK